MLLILLVLASGSSEQSLDLKRNYCNIYSCKPSTVSFKNTTCIYPNLLYSTYYLWPCPASLPYCSPQLSSLQNVTCAAAPPPTVLASYPGEPCSQATDCAFGTCLSGVCFGSNLLEACTTHSDCNPGLRCSSGQCANLIPVSGAGCITDYDCVTSAGCNKNTTTGVCVPYFTLQENSKISTCSKSGQDGISYLCKSTVCLASSSRTAAGICSQAPVSAKANPLECNTNSDCDGWTNLFNYTGVCTCGINPYAASYCQPFMGDLEGRGYVSALKAFVLKGYIQQCNTMRRFSPQCWVLFKNKPEYSTLFLAKFLYDYYPQLQNNDQCIKSIVFPQYYQPVISSGFYLALSALWLYVS